ncbi:MAG: hypothetical protein KTR31_27875 [Myxococcales bacterium]|nr:hypothetical protein [Myxococcales bacterium]
MILAIVVAAVGILLGLGGLGAYLFAPVVWVLPALHAGDYAKAWSRLRWCRWCYGADVLEGALLLHMDRLDESEARLREAEATSGRGAATRAWVHLARGEHELALHAVTTATLTHEPWMELQDDDDEETSRMVEELSRPPFEVLRSICELHAGRVLDVTRERIERELQVRGDEPDDLLDVGWRAEAYAALSWANRALGDAEAAEANAAKALEQLPGDNPPVAGEVHVLLARAAEAEGDTAAALRSWQQAAEADPHGVWGRIAREQLE